MSIQRRFSQASAGLVVGGLHLVGLLVWWTAGRDMRLPATDAARLPSVSVALLAQPTPEAPAARQNLSRPDATKSARSRDDDPKPAAANTTDSANSTTAAGALHLPADGAMGPEAQAPVAPALNLNLSRKDISSAVPRSFAEQSAFRGRLPKPWSDKSPVPRPRAVRG